MFFISVFISFFISIIGSSIVFLERRIEMRKRKITWLILTPIYFVIAFLVTYFAMPSIAYPLLGGYWILFAIFWSVSAIISLIEAYEEDYTSWTHIAWIPIVAILIPLFVSMSGCEMINSGKYSALIGNIENKTKKHWSQDLQPIDPTRIRLVPKELAIALAKTAITKDGKSEGSQFPLSEKYCTLQKINSDYWYLIPLDFSGYKVWTSTNYVPGYVKVSATNPYAVPQFILGKKMKYTPGACFYDDLERILYEKYYDKILTDYSFEEDDNGNVFWVVTVCSPSVTYWGIKVDGIIIFNPETGNNEYVSIENIEKDEKYNWIDRVMPSNIIENYINYWGDLKNGWWNSLWSNLNLLEAETPTMNYSADGKCVFVTPITSTNTGDETMTGLMYTDARTGKSIYYTTTGGATEEAIIATVNSATRYKNWHASEQIVYENIYGKLSALVPILGESGNYQGLGIVENKNKIAAIGVRPQEALVEYQKLLTNSQGEISTENVKDTKEVTAPIVRLGWDILGTSGKTYYITIKNHSNSFLISSPLQAELPLTKEGDVVYIKYVNSGEASVPVTDFKNITLGLKGSKNEQIVIEQMSKKTKEENTKADVKDFKEKIKEMSDEEIKKLIK